MLVELSDVDIDARDLPVEAMQCVDCGVLNPGDSNSITEEPDFNQLVHVEIYAGPSDKFLSFLVDVFGVLVIIKFAEVDPRAKRLHASRFNIVKDEAVRPSFFRSTPESSSEIG